MIMKGRFILDYLDENNFKKLERSLKKYNMVAYKKLMFDFYPKFNCFIEKEVNIDKSNDKEKTPKQTKSSKKQLSMPHRTNPKN